MFYIGQNLDDNCVLFHLHCLLLATRPLAGALSASRSKPGYDVAMSPWRRLPWQPLRDDVTGVRCSGGQDLLSTAAVCLTALTTLSGPCPTGQSAPASIGCHGDVPCVVSGSTSHCGRCPAGYYGNGSVCERECSIDLICLPLQLLLNRNTVSSVLIKKVASVINEQTFRISKRRILWPQSGFSLLEIKSIWSMTKNDDAKKLFRNTALRNISSITITP